MWRASMKCTKAKKKFRSQEWFDNPNNPGMTALYIERYQNQEFTREELQSDRPIIGKKRKFGEAEGLVDVSMPNKKT